MFFFFPFGGGGSGLFLIILIILIIRALRNFRNLNYSGSGDSNYTPSNKAFFTGTFSMLAKLASADGQVSESVKRKINQFMIYDLRLDNQSYNYARSIFNTALNENTSFETFADRFYVQFQGNFQILQLLIDIFYRIAMDDGSVSVNEQRMIDYAVRRFQIPDYVVESILRQYGKSSSSSSKYYSVLGIEESATEQEIKKAYRRLILEYHPDTVSGKEGVGEEFKKYATKRFREVQEAYEKICSERGIK